MKRVWVDSDAALAALLSSEAAAPMVAVDTEFRRRDTYYPQVALLQLCWSDTAYLIDPLVINDLEPLRAMLLNPEVTKFLHSASEDLEVFDRWLGVLPQPLFDTQRAAGLLGPESGQSYRALVEAMLGIEVPKDETQSDWLRRPLSDAQKDYAAMDVLYLREVGQQLLAEATARGRRDWILEDGARMAPGGRGPLARFKSAWKLDRRQQQALAALVDWREQRARSRDKPRSWIADDKVLSSIAQAMPESTDALARIAGLPEALVRRQGDALVACVARAGQAGPGADWVPARPLPRSLKDAARTLAEARDALAGELGMAADVLMGNRELELLVREAAGEVIAAPASWSGWRTDVAVAPLRALAANA